MPSACAKPETKASTEASETVKQCISIVEKKIRNLEKRKGKLDGYKARMSAGDVLNQDQLEAIAKFDGVIQSLELARELHKSFQTMCTDIEKVAKKQAKREKFERTQREVSRTKELLKLQSLLDSMGDETVRENFQTGANGAIKLSEEQLEQLDELYKLISPSREDGDFQEKLKQSSEHIVNILDGVDKPVIGTTYSALNQMISQIQESGYFDQATSEKAEETTAPLEAESAAEESAAAEEEVKPEQEEFTEVSPPAAATAEEEIASQPTGSHVPAARPVAPPQPHFQEESFFSTVAGFNSQPPVAVASNESRVQRPFQEIVSSVQGNFDFLQDSELEAVEGHPIDPAVVAVHPKVPSGNTDLPSHPAAAFQPNLLSGDGAQRSSPFVEQKSSSDSSASQSQLYSQQAAFEQSAAQQNSSSSSAYSTEQTFSPPGLMDNASISFGATSQQSTFMGEQPLSAAAMATDIGPQPIPLPSQALPGQSLSEQNFPAASDSAAFSNEAPVSYSEAAYGATNSSDFAQQQYEGQYADDGSDKKTFTMNPNASIFRSMYTEPPQQGGGSSSSGRGYNSNYNQRQGAYSSHRSNNGAPRGAGGRGGAKVSGSMNNGYSRGGSSGGPRGSSYGGSSNGRGGSSGNTYNRGGAGGAGMRGASSGRGGMRGSNRGTSYARSMQQGNMA
ncbi:hypothetical protein CAPTEDRAFT_169720 [Capitella teleta]|uniref:Caprin-1 dimerization domain-containing protein n=1 Tax=Capitella teleta TaxID=283909 RepID=R7TF38_CAPTE|nr:hypothetical protein CAPTEDRAFT_169720 [Capitella teleta]|eukprot:ELT92363.1 hypothetical protein CAPTEDRAFT_169720 [Capitella teleta]